jgi:UPF0176 protein
MAILNLAAYQFTAIADPEGMRRDLLEKALNLDIKGTILVTPEGLNAFLAAPEDNCRQMLGHIRAIPGFAGLQAKESWSHEVPFQRLKVKCKNEIIRMDHPMIQPEKGRAPSVDAQTLARWLDQGHDDHGRPVVMLDARNDFEVDYGRFENAVDWRIQRFTQFPQAMQDHREELAGKTVVSYCTGGIRCEKAALYMRSEGIDQVLQLEGGILKYFEETDGRHWQGHCFVFDTREALDPGLQPSNSNDATPAAKRQTERASLEA